jgi:hypothetical protein
MTTAPSLLQEYWTFEDALRRLTGEGGADHQSAVDDIIKLATTGSLRFRLWARNYLEQALQAAITEDEDEAPSETGRIS